MNDTLRCVYCVRAHPFIIMTKNQWHDLLSPVEGYTLAEIKRAEEEENKAAQSEITGKEEDDENEAKQSDMTEKDHVSLLIVYIPQKQFL